MAQSDVVSTADVTAALGQAGDGITQADLMGMMDLGPINDDDTDPLAGLEPEWRAFAEHVFECFDPGSLPPMIAPYAPLAMRIVARKLGEDAMQSRAFVLGLIDIAIRDLGLERADIEPAWHDASPPPAA